MPSDAKLKDLPYYMVRWMAFGIAAGLFTPVAPHGGMTDGFLWDVKLQHLIWGILFGAACGYVFTLSQNKFNIRRDRKVSWSIAITIWMGFNFAFAGMSML